MLPRYNWVTGVGDEPRAAALARAHGLVPAAGRALVARGLADDAAAHAFLNPTLAQLRHLPDLPGAAGASRRLWQAIDQRQPIVVFGDYDADGICATALLAAALEAFGASSVRTFLPRRLEEGYGLSSAALARFAAERHAPSVVVTVDCGITAAEGVHTLRAAGHEVIITDHHTPDPALDLSAACAVLNPHHPATRAESRNLCGAGVAFALACAMWRMGKEDAARKPALEQAWNPRDWFNVVALATVADVMPLTGLNRTLVHYGLKRFEVAARPGLRALLSKATSRAEAVTSQQLAFLLGPRLNAAGRLGDPYPAYELLRTADADKARELAIMLNQLNVERRQIEAQILQEALLQLQTPHVAASADQAVVVAGPDWHPGAVGIVAARLCEQRQRPAAVAAIAADNGVARGSLRVASGYNAMAALQECADLLDDFGGHRLAAGFTVKPGMFDTFRQCFAAACASQRTTLPSQPELLLDAWLDPADLTQQLPESLSRLEPFGEGNPRPRWGLKSVTLARHPNPMGQDGDHLELMFNIGDKQIRGVWFRAGQATIAAIEACAGQPFDIAFECHLNHFRNNTDLELRLLDARAGVN